LKIATSIVSRGFAVPLVYFARYCVPLFFQFSVPYYTLAIHLSGGSRFFDTDPDVTRIKHFSLHYFFLRLQRTPPINILTQSIGIIW